MPPSRSASSNSSSERCGARASSASSSRGQQEHRVQVAVAGVAPAAGRQPGRRRSRASRRLPRPAGRAAPRCPRSTLPPRCASTTSARPVAPAPQGGDLLQGLGRVERERVLAEHVEQIAANPRRLLSRAIGLGEHRECARGHARPGSVARGVAQRAPRRGTRARRREGRSRSPARSPRSRHARVE